MRIYFGVNMADAALALMSQARKKQLSRASKTLMLMPSRFKPPGIDGNVKSKVYIEDSD